MDSDSTEEAFDMRIHIDTARLSALRAFAAPAQCPHCGDLMIAPLMSEFVEGGEIRHHWECDACGEPSQTSIPLSAN
jgi:predicted RNA-binding Zn-ribbon protein involved in translation (DUF1610 family)